MRRQRGGKQVQLLLNCLLQKHNTFPQNKQIPVVDYFCYLRTQITLALVRMLKLLKPVDAIKISRRPRRCGTTFYSFFAVLTSLLKPLSFSQATHRYCGSGMGMQAPTYRIQSVVK